MEPFKNSRQCLTFEYPQRRTTFKPCGKSEKEDARACQSSPTLLGAADGKHITAEIPYVITYGRLAQHQYNSPYAGNQCTSMSLAAVAWWSIVGKMAGFTPEDVQEVMDLGDSLHTLLRDQLCVSSVRDGRVAIDDLPRYLHLCFANNVTRMDFPESSFCMTSQKEGEDGIPSLGSFLKQRVEAHGHVPEAYLITVGHFSNALMFTKRRTWLMFDSHGRMLLGKTRCRNSAAVIEMRNLDELLKLIQVLRGCRQLCQILPVTFMVETGTPEAQASPIAAAVYAKPKTKASATIAAVNATTEAQAYPTGAAVNATTEAQAYPTGAAVNATTEAQAYPTGAAVNATTEAQAYPTGAAVEVTPKTQASSIAAAVEVTPEVVTEAAATAEAAIEAAIEAFTEAVCEAATEAAVQFAIKEAIRAAPASRTIPASTTSPAAPVSCTSPASCTGPASCTAPVSFTAPVSSAAPVSCIAPAAKKEMGSADVLEEDKVNALPQAASVPTQAVRPDASHVASSVEQEEEDSMYVAFMGGFGYDD